MLIELYGRNFGCFRDDFQLSMLATDIDPDSERGIVEVKVEGDEKPLRLLRAVALYGPNASGKSTLIRAAGALSNLLSITHRLPSEMPLRDYEPFALDTHATQPVMLGAKAVIDSVVYDYFVAFDRAVIHKEKLSRKSGANPAILFDRTGQEVVGEWRENPQFGLFSKVFRENALLLSLADTLTPELARGIAVGFQRMLTMHDPTPWNWRSHDTNHVAELVSKDSAFAEWLLYQLRAADLGVVELRPEEIRKIVQVVERDDKTGLEIGPRRIFEKAMRIRLLHGGSEGPIPLPYSRESFGTRRLVELSPIIYELVCGLHHKTVFFDEFDASMHPELLKAVVRHFNCDVPAKNVRGQLIFSLHETSLLDAEAKEAVLRRDQVYLTEKDSAGAARLFSVAEFRERNNLNLRRRYLQGRYGALPAIGPFEER